MAKKSTHREPIKQEMCDLIETIDLEDLQKRFMKSRWLDQVLWLEGRAVKSRNRHYTLRLITIIGGVIVPALVSVNSANVRDLKLREFFGWTAFGLSQAVAISAAVEELFHYGENYRRYRNTAEGMKIEGWQFFQLSGPYSSAKSHADAYATFAANVETIIQKDVEGYVSQSTQADAQTKAREQATVAQNLALANMQLREQLQQRPAPSVVEFRDGSTLQGNQPSTREGLYEEDEDEFVTPDQIRGNQFGGMANQGGFAPNSAQAVANEEDEDEFVTPDQIRNPSFGQPGNPWGLPPTRTISNPVTLASNSPQTVEDEEDEFVTPDQIRGNQFGATGSQGGIAPTSTLPKLVTPPPPPLATPEVVADILQCPLEDTQTYLPGVLAALQEKGILDKPTLVAAIATIGVETGGFCPINEYGGESYFTREYEGREDLGNTEPGDGVRFHGRGFIQATGRAVYREYCQKLGLGSALEDNPELALDPEISAKILACYFADRGVHIAAKNSDWQKVRRLVNGGLNGWDTFINYVNRALSLIK